MQIYPKPHSDAEIQYAYWTGLCMHQREAYESSLAYRLHAHEGKAKKEKISNILNCVAFQHVA